jgi:Fe-S cluster assembly protein SufD
MTVAVIKTKAEQALAEQFDHVVGDLPGGSKVRNFRREAIADFAARGLPHRRVEEWKYTDVRTQMRESFARAVGGSFGSQAISETLSGEGHGLLPGLDTHTVIFVDGAFVSSTLPKALAGVEALSLSDALDAMPSWVSDALAETLAPADGVIALNTAYMSGGFAIRVADGIEVDKPIHLIFTQSGDTPKAVTTRCIITTGRASKVTILETHVTSPEAVRQQNALLQLSIGDDAEVQHIKNLTIDTGSIHLANSLVRLGKKAVYKPFQMSTGAGFTRGSLNLTFEGQHAMLDLGAVALGDHDGHADLTMVIDHAVPNCVSRELYKAVLNGNAKGVFQGKVIVRPDAQKTDGKQMARGLLLSPTAEFFSKPELEIYADDVVCGHGTTSMEVDPDMMFYCRSRGIPEQEARTLLVESFIGEAIDKVENEALRAALTGKARAWLMAEGG